MEWVNVLYKILWYEFLHFGVILLCNNNIEKKAWKTFNSFKMQILLVYQDNKTGNGNSKTAKRKSRINSFLESLFNVNLGGLFRGSVLRCGIVFWGFWNLVRKCTYIRSFRIYTFSTKTLLILLMWAFFW